MNASLPESDRAAESLHQERREFRTYVWGLGLALLLTLIPFALVHWAVLSRTALLGVIGILALAQILVHGRCFLHLDFARRRADLVLILFSALLLTIMVGGTLWIMASLAMRMAMPGAP